MLEKGRGIAYGGLLGMTRTYSVSRGRRLSVC